MSTPANTPVTIHLTNSKTRRKEAFTPIDPGNVRMYVCGPTVYDRAHLGNSRPAIVFDALVRLLRHVYGTEHVTYVRNFTDVDDKINARAAAEKRPIAEITEETTRWYLDDMAAIGVAEPDHMPRATAFIEQMIAMIAVLIAKGHAYEAEGHVLFAVDSWRDAYGTLSGRSVDDMIAGARVEVAPYKRNPMDFVLWKPSDDATPGWESPWGHGRPGWHIECSAMAEKLLWEDPKADGRLSEAALAKPHVFDIHGGGNDLLFPHHENEIAQSCCANDTTAMANVWLHNEMLQVEGKKMSKSLGNFFTVRDLLDQGVPGEVIRFVMLSTHYRKPMDWTDEKKADAEFRLFGFIELIALHGDIDAAMKLHPEKAIIDALSDDLNTHAALECLGKMNGPADADALAHNLLFLGLFDETTLRDKVERYRATLDRLSGLGQRLESLREEAMRSKDFSAVDRLKQRLAAAHVSVRMSKEGVDLRPEIDFDPAKLEGL